MTDKVVSKAVEGTAIPAIVADENNALVHARLTARDEFETRRWPYLAALPISWFLTLWVMAKKAFLKGCGLSKPAVNTLWFDGFGPSCRKIKEGAASWKALDIIYNHQFGANVGLSGLVDDFWIGMVNAQAVRNRLKLAKQEVRNAVLRFSGHGEVRLFSLAAGSAQGVIETMAELKVGGIQVRALLLDVDSTALAYAQELARRHGVSGQVEVVEARVSQFGKEAQSFQPHIIEMLGLLDYVPEEKAVRLLRQIRDALEPRGVFLTCNIRSNNERHFLKWVIDWSMIYRTPTQLRSIVIEAGFRQCRLVYEPLQVHGLAIAQKD